MNDLISKRLPLGFRQKPNAIAPRPRVVFDEAAREKARQAFKGFVKETVIETLREVQKSDIKDRYQKKEIQLYKQLETKAKRNSLGEIVKYLRFEGHIKTQTIEKYIRSFREFIKYLQYERQFSPRTIQTYLHYLSELKEFLNKNLLDTTKKDIGKYLIYLKKKPISNASIGTYINAFRTFYKWATYRTNKTTLSNVVFFLTNIIRIKSESNVTFCPTVPDIAKLRETFQNYKKLLSSTPNSHQYQRAVASHAIVETLITTGMRSRELRSLRYDDIDLKNKTVFIKNGKGDCQRLSLLGNTACEALKDFFELNNFKPGDFICPLHQTNSLNYLIKRWAQRARISTRLHAHSFRHYFITESQRQGVSAEVVADQVGHRNLNSTKRYTHFNTEFLKEKYSTIRI